MTPIYSKKERSKTWTLEKVREGFEKFYEEFKRYPTSNEIDDFAYLPLNWKIINFDEFKKEVGAFHSYDLF